MTEKTITVSCPGCKNTIEWSESNPFRPFCSESCKNKDFIGWANEEKKLAGSNIYDDIFSEPSSAANQTGFEDQIFSRDGSEGLRIPL